MIEPSPRELPLRVRALEAIMRPLDKVRPKTLAHAHGRVLEVGVGTGLNLRHYPATVTHLTGVEPDASLLALAERRARALPCPHTFVVASAERLPFEAGCFDAAVITFALCTIPDPIRALREVHRVLAPGGLMTYLEHTRSPHRPMRLAQRVLDPGWSRLSGGCHLMRDPRATVEAAGFRHERYLAVSASPWNPFPVYAGLARARS